METKKKDTPIRGRKPRDSISTNASSSVQRRCEISRHRNSMASSLNTNLNSMSSTTHIDGNDTEIFSGAAPNAIPSSISSFHHHNHYRSPALSISSDQQNIDELALDQQPRLSETTELLDGVESDASDLQERSNFRFFTTEEIESAKGVSSLRRLNSNHHGHNVNIDYDTNWNSYADDYADVYNPWEDEQQSNFSTEQQNGSDTYKKGLPAMLNKISDSNSSSTKSYGSLDENPYSEFFRGDAERGLIADEEQQHADDEEEDGEDEVGKLWGETMKKRAAPEMHDKLFGRKFPTTNTSQRFYIAEEDLVVGIAGYKTKWWKLICYWLLCALSLGLAGLLLRWLPRWRIKMMGDEIALGKAEWVVVEDEYGKLEIRDVERQWYNRNLSTFLQPKKFENEMEEDASKKASDASVKTGVSTAYTIDDVDPIVPVLIWFEYRYMKLFYDPLDDLYKLSNNWIDEKWCHHPDIRDGVSEEIYKCRKLIFGENLIQIKEKPILELLVDEVLHPFYVFQIFSIFLWLADSYYYYAFCIFLISFLSIIESLFETKSTLERMRKLSRFQCDTRVWRNGFWKEVSSDDLVPGDIYEVSDPSLTSFPCDSILLTGDCIVNEAMLTGESVPISKVPISTECVRDLEIEFNSAKFSNRFSKSFLYNGTKIVRVRYGSTGDEGNEPATALVIRTGFNTTKGELVRSMLFPKPAGFKFYEDSFKYIGVMSIIACVGFIFSTINFIRLGLDWSIIVLRALDLITIVIPPALPATLTIGTNFALSRLRKKNIFCIAPTRVNVGGKLDVLCFDKTGTLTEEGLDIMGVHVSQPIRDRKEYEFSDMYRSIDEIVGSDGSNQQSKELFATMLTCHSLKNINAERVGDPLDENMFHFVGWDMVEDPNENEKLQNFIDSHIILTTSSPILFEKENETEFWIQLKEFEFISHLRRMSVVCQSSINEDFLEVFVKGAPEVMEGICLSETLPINYNELLYRYTHNGYRVIACATKKIKYRNKNNLKDLSFIGELTREECETNLEFVGFIIFENKLKESTKDTLAQLRNAELRTVMCTGDNVLTAISVGKEGGMISSDSKVYVPSFNYDMLTETVEEEGNGSPDVLVNGIPPIVWTEVDDPDLSLDPVTLAPLNINQDNNYCIAVTGDIFKFILTELPHMGLMIEKMLMKGAIFARMSPDEKHELVNKLRELDYTVGFCGDGANDCGALKAADVGISLSEAEASVAAPFTSRIFEISCVLDVIREGRASLVTSFSCFQYMSLYSAIQFITVSILYKEGSNLGDFQFLYIDLILIIPIAIFMSWSKPYHTLCKKRPTANLISSKILIPLIGNISLLLVGQFSAWWIVKSLNEPWYIKPTVGSDDEVQSTDNTALFFYSNFQYILVALMLTVGPPYREPAIKNYPFILTILITLGWSVLLMLIDVKTWFGQLMDLTWMNIDVKTGLVLGALINYLILELGDKFIFIKLARLFKLVFKKKGSNKKFKKLKKEFKKLSV